MLGANGEKGLRKEECQKATTEVEKMDTVGEAQCQKHRQKVKRFHLILFPVNQIYQCLPPHTHRENWCTFDSHVNESRLWCSRTTLVSNPCLSEWGAPPTAARETHCGGIYLVSSPHSFSAAIWATPFPSLYRLYHMILQSYSEKTIIPKHTCTQYPLQHYFL